MYYTNWPQPWNIPTKQNFYASSGEVIADPTYFSGLEHQKEILETNLADCVTYLQALRKKHARGARQLDSGSYLPRKKKKKIQQNMRQLNKEIKYRERDEEAFLNNLQACKTNIYLAETVSSPSTSVPSTIPDFASDSTLSPYSDKSKPTELSWCGRADKTVHPSSQRNPSNPPPLVNGMVLDGHFSLDGIMRTEKAEDCPRSDIECVEHTNATWSLPVTCVPTQFTFRPEAAVFKPRAMFKDQNM